VGPLGGTLSGDLGDLGLEKYPETVGVTFFATYFFVVGKLEGIG